MNHKRPFLQFHRGRKEHVQKIISIFNKRSILPDSNNNNNKYNSNNNYNSNSKLIIFNKSKISNINQTIQFILPKQEAMAMEEYKKVKWLFNIARICHLLIIMQVQLRMLTERLQTVGEVLPMTVQSLWLYPSNLVSIKILTMAKDL